MEDMRKEEMERGEKNKLQADSKHKLWDEKK